MTITVNADEEKFTVKVSRETTDVISASLSIPAKTPEEAIEKAKDLWKSGDLVLAYEGRVAETGPTYEVVKGDLIKE